MTCLCLKRSPNAPHTYNSTKPVSLSGATLYSTALEDRLVRIEFYSFGSHATFKVPRSESSREYELPQPYTESIVSSVEFARTSISGGGG